MADPTQTNISQTTIPDYAKPYVENLLGIAQGTAFQTDATGKITGMQPYKSYPGERTADFTDLQNKAFQGAQNLGPASQLTDATSMAQRAGLGALGTQYQAGQFTNQYGYSPQQVGTQQFTGDQVSQYMNPYLQNALQPALQEVRRQYDITGAQEKGNATRQGAFGGSRQALMQAENQRNANMGMNQLIGQGYNQAYQNAAQQFNAQQQANLQAQLANQQAGLSSAQAGAQYGQAAQQLGEQSRQFGAGLGLQGLQTGLQAAGALGNLGATQFGQQTQTIGLQGQAGGTQQQQQQNILNQQYQDFLNQKQYPYQQIGFMSDMLRGLPLAQTSTAMYANPNLLTQAAGIGFTGAALKNAGLFGAKGGLPEDFERKERPAGLAELAIYNMA